MYFMHTKINNVYTISDRSKTSQNACQGKDFVSETRVPFYLFSTNDVNIATDFSICFKFNIH